MGMMGADLAQMQQLETTLQQESVNVQELMQRITRTLANTTWTGPAADRFKQEWNDQFARALKTLAEALDQNSKAVQGRRLAFEAASK